MPWLWQIENTPGLIGDPELDGVIKHFIKIRVCNFLCAYPVPLDILSCLWQRKSNFKALDQINQV